MLITATQKQVHNRARSTVSFPIGGHVNVLSDYNETVPENLLFLHNHCSHVTDMVITFCQKTHISGCFKMHTCALPVNIDII